MITSIYLANNNVRAVTGTGSSKKVSIKQAYHTVLKEGCLINGIITNEEELKEELSDFWEENHLPKKNVNLVLESSRITIKKLEFPKMKSKMIRQSLPHEFEEIEDAQSAVFDYLDSGKHGNSMLIRAAATEREYIEGFLKIFKEIGIELNKIQVGRHCLLHVLNTLKEYKDKTVVYLILDGNHMTSILSIEGEIVYSTQRRIFAEQGTDAFALDIARSISTLQQFMMTQYSENQIEEVCIAGVEEDTVNLCRDSIAVLDTKILVSQMQLGNNIRFSGDNEEACQYLFAIGSLMPTAKDVDFKAASKIVVKKEKEGKNMIQVLSLPIILLVGLGLIAGSFYFKNSVKQMELDSINDYLENPNNIEMRDREEILQAHNEELERRVQSIRYMNEVLDSYPEMVSEVLAQIEKQAQGYAEIVVKGYQASNGLLSVDASADDVTKINQFIDRLQESELFEKLDYTGYIFNETTNTYTINVSCYLSEIAGKN